MENCKNLTDVVIQAPVVNMEMGMFQNCTSLQRVTLPGTVQAKVNGEVCTMRGKKLRPGDEVEFMGSSFRITEK